METNEAVSGDGERKDKSEKAKVENGFYNVIEGEEVFRMLSRVRKYLAVKGYQSSILVRESNLPSFPMQTARF
jgi:hypothetical protein